MSFFRYEAIDRAGKIVMGTMDAPDERAVNARLAQMGYTPQSVAPARAAANAARGSAQPSAANSARGSAQPAAAVERTPSADAKTLALFFQQFATLVRSGISLYQSLENLGPRTPHPTLSRAAGEMAQAAHGGQPISSVMERYPFLFASHVVSSVRAGETGGFLEIVLEEISYDYEQEVAFRKGLWLPQALILQGLFAVAIGQPVFPHLFPPPSHWDVYLKLVFLRNIPIVLIILLVVRLWYTYLQQPQNRDRRDGMVLKLPIFGDLVRQKSLASFVRMLRRLYHAGIGPIGAWEGAMNVAPNAVIRERLVTAAGMMRNNVPLHDAFRSTGLFANETEQLLATGVMSGQVVDMLDRVAEYYQNNVGRAFDRARFTLFRIGFTSVIILSGLLVIIFAKNYFASIFEYVDREFPTP